MDGDGIDAVKGDKEFRISQITALLKNPDQAARLPTTIRGSQSTEFRADSVVDSDLDSGPLWSPASSCSRFCWDRESMIRFCEDRESKSSISPNKNESSILESIRVSESVQNRFQHPSLRIDTESRTLTSPIEFGELAEHRK
jgi:hypothetical protein